MNDHIPTEMDKAVGALMDYNRIAALESELAMVKAGRDQWSTIAEKLAECLRSPLKGTAPLKKTMDALAEFDRRKTTQEKD